MSISLISIAEARDRVLEQVSPLSSETVAIADALGRVLAHEVRAAANVPSFPSSAMDGYAVIAGEAGRTLDVIGESRAGAPTADEVSEGVAIRISTGAAVPSGASGVIPQEDVERTGDSITTRAAVAAGQNVREPGEDMRADALVLESGTRLAGVELGAATAAGVGAVTVARRPGVSVLCTGDELRAPGEPLGPGEIHNSNAPMLIGLAANAGAVTLPPSGCPTTAARRWTASRPR